MKGVFCVGIELTRLKRQRTSDEVYQALRQSILSHLFAPGERLQVEDIAAKLRVSLTPVRQAIQQLASEGLIEVRPRSGTFVTRLSTRDGRDPRATLRAGIPGGRACRLADYAGEQMAGFRGLLERLGRPVESAEARKQHEPRNAQLHRLLVQCADNRRLA